MSSDENTEDTEKSSPHDQRGEESAESAEATESSESTVIDGTATDLTEGSAAEDPLVSGSSEAEFDEAMRKAQESHDEARENMERIDPGDQSEMPAGEVEIAKPDEGKPGDPGTFLTVIEPAGDDTGDADPGQPGGDIPVDPAEATNAQNEQIRQERLAVENRPENSEVNNSNREYNAEIARFSESEAPEEELGPYE